MRVERIVTAYNGEYYLIERLIKQDGSHIPISQGLNERPQAHRRAKIHIPDEDGDGPVSRVGGKAYLEGEGVITIH